MGEEEEELVVKWFFNASTTPFYQWVPALDVGPQVIMREAPGEIDINYSVEGENSFTKHRTLRIAEATLAHIGAYTCQVSSFTHEVSSTVDVAVYVPPSSLVLTSTSSATDDLISLTCVATDAFPAPILSLAWTESLVAREGETFSKSSEEQNAEQSALQREEAQTVDDDDDNKDEESEEDEESSATRSSTFVSSSVFFSALVYLIFC